jgi:5-methylcytosine-specific restriction endonuclease McrA
MGTRVLKLNADWQPLDIVEDYDAIMDVLDGKVEMIEHSGVHFRSAGGLYQEPIAIPVPSVMRLVRYADVPYKAKSVMLKPPNVLGRDDYTCAYCGKTGLRPGRDGTMDHVYPLSRPETLPRGIRYPHCWENVTASCKRCNHRKGDQLLSELGWTMLRPYPCPRPLGVAARLLTMAPDPEWRRYLQVA